MSGRRGVGERSEVADTSKYEATPLYRVAEQSARFGIVFLAVGFALMIASAVLTPLWDFARHWDFALRIVSAALIVTGVIGRGFKAVFDYVNRVRAVQKHLRN